MAITNVRVENLLAAYRTWFGEPAKRLEFSHEQVDHRVPTELEVLFFQPANFAELPEAKCFTYIATAGMSTRTLSGPYERVEFIQRVDGRYSEEDLDQLGRTLAQLSVVPFLEHLAVAPGQLLGDIPWPIFVGMNSMLLTDCAIVSNQLSTDEPVAILLNVIPLFQGEAEIIARIGELEAGRRFLREGINWHDPRRRSAALSRMNGWEVEGRQTEVMSSLESIDQSWDEIEDWYRKNASEALEELNQAASDDEISELENHLGVSLPEDYKASLRRHNGGGRIHNYNYLSSNTVQRSWDLMRELKAEGKFDDSQLETDGTSFEPTWWHLGWTPVAEHKTGSLICLDLAPLEPGLVGQILRVDTHYDGPSTTKYRSFAEWLSGYKEELYSGLYAPDDHGNLSPV
jgi:cell wall assembly regulator SMI1